jgi:hypothetical protein
MLTRPMVLLLPTCPLTRRSFFLSVPAYPLHQVITDSGDPVCLTVEGPSGESVLVPRLPLRRGGARQDLLVDGAGRALAGYQGGRLKVRGQWRGGGGRWRGT